jgi:hypothetical protein
MATAHLIPVPALIPGERGTPRSTSMPSAPIRRGGGLGRGRVAHLLTGQGRMNPSPRRGRGRAARLGFARGTRLLCAGFGDRGERGPSRVRSTPLTQDGRPICSLSFPWTLLDVLGNVNAVSIPRPDPLDGPREPQAERHPLRERQGTPEPLGQVARGEGAFEYALGGAGARGRPARPAGRSPRRGVTPGRRRRSPASAGAGCGPRRSRPRTRPAAGSGAGKPAPGRPGRRTRRGPRPASG